MKLLAIDPGGQMGVAWHPGVGRISPCRVENWNLERAFDPGRRYALMLKLLGQHRNADRLVWEISPRVQGQYRRWYFGYLATAQLWCAEHDVDFLGVNPGTVKFFATADRRAPKYAMRAAAAAFFRDERLRDMAKFTEHQIDALWILGWAVTVGDREARGAA